MILPIVAGWLACSVLFYGLNVAFFQRHWPELAQANRVSDRVIAAAWALIGPLALIAWGIFLLTEKSRGSKGWMA